MFLSTRLILFEDPDVVSRFRADPQGFLDSIKGPVILDEIQNVPEVFNYLRSRIDATPRAKGRWLLTGSQESALMQNVSESMAGRAGILQLLPFSLAEMPSVSLLSCYLLGIQTEAELERSPFLGAIFEGQVAVEIMKSQINAGRHRELYYFRDQQGLEVDFIAPTSGGKYRPIEAKSTRTPLPSMAKPMQSLASAWQNSGNKRELQEGVLVHRAARMRVASQVLASGVHALPLEEFVRSIN